MASFSFSDFGSSGADATNYTDTLTLPAGGAEREIFLVFAGRRGVGSTTTAISAVTLATVAMAVVNDGTNNAFLLQTTADTSGDLIGIYKLSAASLGDPTATSVAMSVTVNGTGLIRAGWAVGVTADAIAALATAIGSDSENKEGVASDATLDVSLNTPAGGIVVAGCFVTDTTAASASNAWTGATEPVGGDFQTGGESARFGCAAESNVAAATPRTVSVTMTHAGNQFAPVALAVSFAPVDVTAPTLSNPSATSAGQTTADLAVDTDEGNGTLSWVVTTSSTSPSGAQVAAGQDHTGASAADSGSQSVSGTGTQNANASGLTAGTTYWAHFVQDDAAANRSDVASSASFATDAAPASTTSRWPQRGGVALNEEQREYWKRMREGEATPVEPPPQREAPPPPKTERKAKSKPSEPQREAVDGRVLESVKKTVSKLEQRKRREQDDDDEGVLLLIA